MAGSEADVQVATRVIQSALRLQEVNVVTDTYSLPVYPESSRWKTPLPPSLPGRFISTSAINSGEFPSL